uniref:Uncharacterized protein n=1 Tax=Oryza sativa subsp. japonica TaxID=39947 RepID=Q6H816_ORYSJ|nr:hypothetical protein [Oryza sativa Japonica Group]
MTEFAAPNPHKSPHRKHQTRRCAVGNRNEIEERARARARATSGTAAEAADPRHRDGERCSTSIAAARHAGGARVSVRGLRIGGARPLAVVAVVRGARWRQKRRDEPYCPTNGRSSNKYQFTHFLINSQKPPIKNMRYTNWKIKSKRKLNCSPQKLRQMTIEKEMLNRLILQTKRTPQATIPITPCQVIFS